MKTYRQLIKYIKLEKLTGNAGIIQAIIYANLLESPKRPTLYELAIEVGLSERTLQRRLEEEGTSVQVIHAGVQKLRVAYFATQPFLQGMLLNDVALFLGFSDHTSFHSYLASVFGMSWFQLMDIVDGKEIPLPWPIEKHLVVENNHRKLGELTHLHEQTMDFITYLIKTGAPSSEVKALGRVETILFDTLVSIK